MPLQSSARSVLFAEKLVVSLERLLQWGNISAKKSGRVKQDFLKDMLKSVESAGRLAANKKGKRAVAQADYGPWDSY